MVGVALANTGEKHQGPIRVSSDLSKGPKIRAPSWAQGSNSSPLLAHSFGKSTVDCASYTSRSPLPAEKKP
jgi:hypothetical protein